MKGGAKCRRKCNYSWGVWSRITS